MIRDVKRFLLASLPDRVSCEFGILEPMQFSVFEGIRSRGRLLVAAPSDTVDLPLQSANVETPLEPESPE